MQRMMALWRQEHEADLNQEDEDYGRQQQMNEADRADIQRQTLAQELEAHNARRDLEMSAPQHRGQEQQMAGNDLELNQQLEQDHNEQSQARQMELEPEPEPAPEPIHHHQRAHHHQPHRPVLPKGHAPYTEPPHHHSLGEMNIRCSHCQSLHFDSERLTNSSKRNPKFGSCCLQGQIKLPELR